MKLRHILFNRVKSDTGFIVKIRPFEGYAEYREGASVATVPVQLVVGQALVHLHKDTAIKWNPPYDAELISGRKREKKYFKTLIEAMRFRKCPTEIV